ncbi:sulfatase-like hydrolase/transferase [Helicobacter sp.]|uniref:sulfatase-like hydrolase/transferase n=1 Tax=Helicobacter sp. TaxID=218 RepID=UPI0025BFF41F|nr:sulfatase-like hydrolase/transferase [Helicobacter sp.]
MNFLSFLRTNLSKVLFLFACNAILLIGWNYFCYFFDSPLWFFEKLAKSLFSTILIELLCLHLIFLILPRFAHYILSLLVVASAILFIVEGFLLYSYHSLITPYVIDAIAQTNLQEMKEFFISFLNIKIFLVAFGFLLVSLVYFKFFPIPQTALSHKLIKIFFAFYALLGLIFIADITNRYFKHKPEPFAKLNENSLTRFLYSLSQYYGSASFYTSYKQLVSNYQLLRESYQGSISKSPNSPQHIVLVIGESTSRNFLNVYGYELPNTPFLSALANNWGGGATSVI